MAVFQITMFRVELVDRRDVGAYNAHPAPLSASSATLAYDNNTSIYVFHIVRNSFLNYTMIQ